METSGYKALLPLPPIGVSLSLAAILTAAVILGALVLMMRGYSPDLVLLGSVVVLLLTQVVDAREAFEGFSNPGMLTVAALFVVAAGLRETGAVSYLSTLLLGRPRSTRGALLRLVGPVVAGSAFLNNTTVVAALLPAVHDWGRRFDIPASRLLIPLSYASILGGVCTLIGTSTNLVVAGLVLDAMRVRTDLHALGMFEISAVGVPIALTGSAVLVALGPWLLPDRRPAVSLSDDPREYTIELEIPAGSHLAGRSIEEAGLRNLPGAYLMEIARGRRVFVAVEPQERLQDGDRLIFAGDVDAMVDLQRYPGLRPATDQVFKLEGSRDERVLVEAVVSERNPLRGMTIRDGRFRTVYKAAVIAVARAGERVRKRIGDIVLTPGDVLLVEAHPDFVAHQRVRNDFYLASQVAGAAPPRLERAWIALAILGALVTVIAAGLLTAVAAAFLAAGAMMATRCCTAPEARRALDWPVLVAIASAFGLGNAMQASGLDQTIAHLVISAGLGHPLLALAAIYVGTVLLTEVVTNNAAAVLAFPLALSVADQLEVAPMGFVIAVMIAASASFLTPIGYQTNLMVYGPGGYHASDYLRVGVPISLVTAAIALAVIPMVWAF